MEGGLERGLAGHKAMTREVCAGRTGGGCGAEQARAKMHRLCGGDGVVAETSGDRGEERAVKRGGQGSQKRSWRLTDSSAVMEGRQAGEKAPESGGERPSLREGNQHKG